MNWICQMLETEYLNWAIITLFSRVLMRLLCIRCFKPFDHVNSGVSKFKGQLMDYSFTMSEM